MSPAPRRVAAWSPALAGLRGTGLVAAALVLTAGSADAQEFCVVCKGPDATYRCVLDKAVPTGLTLKTLCTGALARQGNHEACSVTGGTVFDCKGPIRRLDAREAAAQIAAPPAMPAAPVAASSAKAAPGPAPAAPQADKAAATPAAPAEKPKPPAQPTLEKVVKDMGKSSAETLSKAGKGLSKLADQTWRCIGSLLSDCK